MIEALLPLLTVSQSMLWTGLAVFIRISTMMAVLPAFGDQPVPTRVRLTLAVMFTIVVAPAIAPSVSPMPDGLLEMGAALGPEVLSGLFFGLFLRFFILTLQIAGTMAAQSVSLSQIFGGTAAVDPQPAIGHILVVGGTALAAIMGLHVQAAAYMINSYAMVPFGFALMPDMVAEVGIAEIGKTFALAFTLAAPFLIATLIYNLVLGAINRAMPQLMVSFVGAPALTAGGLFLFFLTAPLMLAIWIDSFQGFMASPFADKP